MSDRELSHLGKKGTGEIILDSYMDNPLIRGLVQSVSVNGIPFGTMLDSVIHRMWSNMSIERTKTFLDELSRCDPNMARGSLATNDTAHAVVIILDTVSRTRRYEKIRLFARLFANYAFYKDMNIDQFEEHLSILDEMSVDEFTILGLLHSYERDPENQRDGKPQPRIYWAQFVVRVATELSIDEGLVQGKLRRLVRTGLYEDIQVTGLNGTVSTFGKTTPNFDVLLVAVREFNAKYD